MSLFFISVVQNADHEEALSCATNIALSDNRYKITSVLLTISSVVMNSLAFSGTNVDQEHTSTTLIK